MAGDAVLAVGAFDDPFELRGRVVHDRRNRQPIDVAVGYVRQADSRQHDAGGQARDRDPGAESSMERVPHEHTR